MSDPPAAGERRGAAPTMQLGGLDWLLAGSTVALGIALVAAPLALVPRLASLYALHGAPGDAPGLSRWMMTPWLAPLLGAGPMAVAIWSTVTRLRPRRRRVVLVAALLAAIAAVALFTRGMLGPVLT